MVRSVPLRGSGGSAPAEKLDLLPVDAADERDARVHRFFQLHADVLRLLQRRGAVVQRPRKKRVDVVGADGDVLEPSVLGRDAVKDLQDAVADGEPAALLLRLEGAEILRVKNVWFEPGVRETKKLTAALEKTLLRFARFKVID